MKIILFGVLGAIFYLIAKILITKKQFEKGQLIAGLVTSIASIVCILIANGYFIAWHFFGVKI